MDTAAQTEAPARLRPEWLLFGVLAVGGALGAAGRYGVELLLPDQPGAFPLGTFLVNVVGCLVLGALAGTVYRADRHRLLLPFVGPGLLGGFTTFSTYTVQTVTLALDGVVGTAAGYLLTTLVAGFVAVEAGLSLSRWLAHGRFHRRRVAQPPGTVQGWTLR